MDYFPAFLDLRDRQCLVVGGGSVALRKIRLLTDAGARVSVVATAVSDELRSYAEAHNHEVVQRAFRPDDIDGRWLVVSATGDPNVERTVYFHATNAGVFCNGVDSIENCSYITPAIVDRGQVVVAISSGGTAPVLARKIRETIEAALPAGIAALAALAARWRSRVKQRLVDVAERRLFWERVVDGPVGEDAIAGNSARADRSVAELLSKAGNGSGEDNPGQAWLVGAGPGDPGLLTLRALQVMQTADVILYDRLVSEEILTLARRDADRISVGKTPGGCLNSQEEINALLVKLVREGKRVCRLKGGDPFIFGRGGEELAALQAAGARTEVIPGITAAAGCAAATGIPLTHRDLAQSVAMVTAHGKDSIDNLDWASLARDRQTIAFYMAVRRFPDLLSNLVAHGRSADTPVAIVERGTTPEQRVIRGTLGQLNLLAEANRVQAPAMLIVGEVAALGVDASFEAAQIAEKYAKPAVRTA